MDILGAILGSLVGVVIGIFGGLKVGGWLRSSPGWVYWAANAAALALGMAAVFVGLAYEIEAVWVGGIAFMGGSLTGLKYGLGRSVGLWRTMDNITGTDDLPKG
jgi:FAD/FMN-containing dehydrogenase